MVRMGRRERRVIGIGGVFLRARNPGKLADWYRDHLGMSIKNQVAVFKWISPRGKKSVGNTLWAALAAGDRGWGRTNSTAQVNYRVANLDRLLKLLSTEGVRVSATVDESKYGRFGWAEDPEGNRLELWEPPKKYRSPDRHVSME